MLVRAVLLTALSLAIFAAWQWIPSRRAATPVYQSGPIVNAIAFSRDRGSRYVAAVLSDGRARMWEADTRRELPVKLPSKLSLNDLAWSPDGVFLTGGFEQTVLAWDVKAAQAKRIPALGLQIVSLASRPGRGEILVSLLNGQVFLIDARSSERDSITTGHKGIVKVVRYAPQGDVFVTAGADGQLVWHDSKSRKVLRTVSAHQHEISSLAFSENGQKLVSGSWDQTAKVWENQWKNPTDKPLVTLAHTSEIAQIAWMGTDVVTSCWDEQLRIWTPESSSLIHQVPWNHGSMAFAVVPGEREVLGIDADGTWHTAKP